MERGNLEEVGMGNGLMVITRAKTDQKKIYRGNGDKEWKKK